jgi:hypothetical protein
LEEKERLVKVNTAALTWSELRKLETRVWEGRDWNPARSTGRISNCFGTSVVSRGSLFSGLGALGFVVGRGVGDGEWFCGILKKEEDSGV